MTFGPDERLYVKADDVVLREAGDELVILELTTTTYLTLNGSAKQLWLGLLTAPRSRSWSTLSGQFGISPDRPGPTPSVRLGTHRAGPPQHGRPHLRLLGRPNLS